MKNKILLAVVLVFTTIVITNVQAREVPAEYAGFSENPYWHAMVADYDTAKAEGQEIYVAKCQSCHGASGLGEQETAIPGATSFADAAMTAEMSDAFWYWKIAEGISGTAMPAWKDQLTEEEVWKVMAYEHSFSHDEAHLHGASQYDSDGDGVPNDADHCPGTPSGVTVDHNGCASSQLDSDGDGVTNDKDKCPDTLTGETVDTSGCPENKPPVATLSASSTTITEGESVFFDAIGSFDPDGPIVAYSWDFGDGYAGTGKTISHTYSTRGGYAVSLTVKDDAGATAISKIIITVEQKVVPTIPPTTQAPTTQPPVTVPPAEIDSDGDGLSDPFEKKKGTDPFSIDTDGDGLTDGQEVSLKTDPLDMDTDDDGIIDSEDIDPLISKKPVNFLTAGIAVVFIVGVGALILKAKSSRKTSERIKIRKPGGKHIKTLVSPWCPECNKYKGRQAECPHCGYKEDSNI